jgi:hypothetical protein
MPPEPAGKRTVVFIGGQNLFHSARATRRKPPRSPHHKTCGLRPSIVAGDLDGGLSSKSPDPWNARDTIRKALPEC